MFIVSLVLGIIASLVGAISLTGSIAAIDPARRWLLLIFGIALVAFSLIKLRS